MKRTELIPGQPYLLNSHQDWITGHFNERAVVLTPDPYVAVEQARWSTQRSNESQFDVTLPDGEVVPVTAHARLPRHNEKATGVLVGILDDTDHFEEFKVVPLGHLRAPWDEGIAQQERDAAARDAARALNTERKARIAARKSVILDALVTHGANPSRVYLDGEASSVSVPLDILEDLLGIAREVQ